MFLPFRSKNPPESLPIATCILITLNVVFYALTSDGFSIHKDVAINWGLRSSHLDPLHMLTSMFLHGSLLHLLGNMWFLYLFGFAVEGRLRTFKFVVLYLVAGFAGSLAHHFVFGQLNPDMPLIGASGAIMGVMGAALFMFPYAQIMILWSPFIFYWRVITWPMWGMAAIYIGLDLLSALLTGAAGGRGGGVANLAHLGGVASGFLLCALFRPKRDSEMASEAKATLSETKDYSILSAMELAELHRSNPNETEIVLHWMHRSIRDNRVSEACRDTFDRMLPKLLAEQPVESVASCLHQTWTDGKLTPRQIIDIGARLERVPAPGLALKFYELAYGDPKATAADHEACLFRVGMLCEASLGNPMRAVATYTALVEGFPMSPMADQAKARLNVLAARR